ncbi:hypothetical protein MHM84_13810 [Halomonas sp. McH1-25]|uniref:hypothetical protein n=1 Tax=unclassified Halomonas TaxID=2609666 RepID=UPI001EF6136F|nr:MULTISPECIES: hypothetical protein [unclassified Halomonas]MCG7600862.1 hypothetical protein [Halomonas sp. McH1-25]MCP1343806.1 hypothetical protein [Halomonas sp. FL8]MCP1360041.1 hypothetical protein [Halomonas sp. BBD45]MCP1363934.1 hypothetical protein [Halomonas sp. BBD48]
MVIRNQPNVGADPLLSLIASHGTHIAGKTEANIGAIASLVANRAGVSIMNPITAYDQLHKRDEVAMRPFSPQIDFSFGLVYRED